MSLFDEDLVASELPVEKISNILIDTCNEMVPNCMRHYMDSPRITQVLHSCCIENLLKCDINFLQLYNVSVQIDHYERHIPVYKCNFSVMIDTIKIKPDCKMSVYVGIEGVKNVEYEFV